MGCGTILSGKFTLGRSSREGGWSLIEMTVTLFLLMAIALFGMKAMISGFLLQNWSIGQSMTDAYAGIETANAQREVFANIPDRRAMGDLSCSHHHDGGNHRQTPFNTVKATLIRTYHVYGLDPVTGAVSYLLESYVVYQDGQRKYCKVSKVYRSQ